MPEKYKKYDTYNRQGWEIEDNEVANESANWGVSLLVRHGSCKGGGGKGEMEVWLMEVSQYAGGVQKHTWLCLVWPY